MVDFFLRLIILFTLCACSHLFYFPQKDHLYQPSQFKLEYKDLYFTSSDGIKLHGWLLPAKGTKTLGTILHFHGNAENISTHFFNLAWLVKEGYQIMVFDYRGYGLSEGSPHQYGLYQDALAAMDEALKWHLSHANDGKFIIYGQSLGGIVSLRAIADFKHQEKVDLIVQDSTFSSYQDIAFDKLTDRWFLVPFSPLTFLVVSDNYASDDVFEKIKQPTLVIVGQQDEIVPQKFGKKIFRELKTQKWLWKIPEGKHIDIFHISGGKYRKDFLDLLNQV